MSDKDNNVDMSMQSLETKLASKAFIFEIVQGYYSEIIIFMERKAKLFIMHTWQRRSATAALAQFFNEREFLIIFII